MLDLYFSKWYMRLLKNGTCMCARQCAAGTSSNADGTACEFCVAGTYSSVGSDSCTACESGTFSLAGATGCTACSAGEVSTSGASECTQVRTQPKNHQGKKRWNNIERKFYKYFKFSNI